jgi:cobalt-zinc-cadmium efflux system outer membrane protein
MRRSCFRRAPKRVLISLGVLLLTLPVWAEEAELTLTEAIQRTLTESPLLRAQGFLAEAQNARIAQAAVGPAPQLGLMVENAAGTGAFSGLDAAETTLSVNWVLAKSRVAAAMASAEAAASRLVQDRALAQLNVSSQTAQHFLSVLRAQGLETLAQGQAADATRARKAAQRLFEAGQGSPAEVKQGELDEARAALLAEEARHELAVARRQLAAQWGKPAPTFPRAQGDWSRLPPLPTLGELENGLAASPYLQRFEEDGRVLEAAEALALENNRTLWTLNGGVRHFALGDDLALVASITATLPQSTRRSARQRELSAERSALRAEAAGLSEQLKADLFELHAQLARARHQAEQLDETLLPLVRGALDHYREGYEAGLYPLPLVRSLEQERWALERERLELVFEAHRARVALERLSGLALPAPALEWEQN